MKWNTVGIIKVAVIGVLFILNLFPLGAYREPRISFVIAAFIVAVVAVPFLCRLNAKTLRYEIEKPDWNENPLDLRKPLNFFQFLAVGFLAVGAANLIVMFINVQALNHMGLMSVSFGLGLLTGIFFTYQRSKEEE